MFNLQVPKWANKLRSIEDKKRTTDEIRNELRFISTYVNPTVIDTTQNVEGLIAALRSVQRQVNDTLRFNITPVLMKFLRSNRQHLSLFLRDLSISAGLSDFSVYTATSDWWVDLVGGRTTDGRTSRGKLPSLILRTSAFDYEEIFKHFFKEIETARTLLERDLQPDSIINDCDDIAFDFDARNYLELAHLSNTVYGSSFKFGFAGGVAGADTEEGWKTFAGVSTLQIAGQRTLTTIADTSFQCALDWIKEDTFKVRVKVEVNDDRAYADIYRHVIQLPFVFPETKQFKLQVMNASGMRYSETTQLTSPYSAGTATANVDVLDFSNRGIFIGNATSIDVNADKDSEYVLDTTEVRSIALYIPVDATAGDAVPAQCRAFEYIIYVKCNFISPSRNFLQLNDGTILDADTEVKNVLGKLRVNTARLLVKSLKEGMAYLRVYEEYLEETTQEVTIRLKYIVDRMLSKLHYNKSTLLDTDVICELSPGHYYTVMNFLTGKIHYYVGDAVQQLSITKTRKLYSFLMQQWIKRINICKVDPDFLSYNFGQSIE